MLTDVGEYFVGAYLQLCEGCDLKPMIQEIRFSPCSRSSATSATRMHGILDPKNR